MLALPRAPPLLHDLVDVLVLELDRNGKTRGAMNEGVGSDEEARLGVDADEQRCVEAVRVLPHVVNTSEVASELDLKPPFLGVAPPDRLAVGEECVGHYAESLALRRLERDPVRLLLWRRLVNDPAPLLG